jgi:hypothetical protein
VCAGARVSWSVGVPCKCMRAPKGNSMHRLKQTLAGNAEAPHLPPPRRRPANERCPRILQNTHVTHVTPGAPAAGGLGDSCQSGADNPQIPYFGGFDLIFWRIRRIRSASARFKCPVCVRMPDAAGFEGCAPARVAERRSHTCFLFDTGTSLPTGCQLHEQIALAHVGCRQDVCGAR